MKTKTIQKNIREKMNEWLESITDEKLRKSVRNNLMVAGGAIANMYLQLPPNDYDVYIMDQDVALKLAEYYCSMEDITVFDGRNREELITSFLIDKYEDNGEIGMRQFEQDNSIMAVIHRTLKEDQVKIVLPDGGMEIPEGEKDDPYSPLYFSPNAITLSDDVQIVCRFTGSPEQILSNYDFSHATNYFTMGDGLVCNELALQCLLSRELRYQGSKYPITSIIRSRKFVERGYTINAGEYLKMCYQVSQLDLDNPDVLEEQLIGVDIAYFNRIINALRSFDPDKSSFENYLFSLIDKMFN